MVEMEVNGAVLRVSRHRKHKDGKSALRVEVAETVTEQPELYRDGENIAGPGLKDVTWKDISKSTNPATDKLLQSILCVDKTTFLYTTILGQGLMFRFSQLTDQARKEVLESITDLAVFETARKLARKQSKETKSHLDGLTGQFNELQTSTVASEMALLAAKKDQREAEDRKTARRGELTKAIQDSELAVTRLRHQLVGVEDIVEDLQIQTLQGSIDEKQRAAGQKHEELGGYQLAVSMGKQALSKMAQLGEGPCQTCGTMLTKDALAAEAKSRALHLTTSQAKFSQVTAELEPILSEIAQLKATVQEMQKSRQEAERKRSGIEREIQQIESQIETSRRLLVQVDEDDQHAKLVQRAETTLQNVRERKTTTAQSMAVEQQTLAEQEFWVVGFQEIRVRVIDQMLDYLNSRLKHYCNVMTSGDIGVQLLHDDKGKIDLIVTTKGGSYASASGGEKDRIDIAIAFALHDLATQRTDFRSNVLVLDEVAVFVDDAGIERLMQLVAEKLDRVETTFLITQNPVFRGYCDKVWRVVKDSFLQVSRIQGVRTSTPSTVSEPVGEGTPLLTDDEGRLWVHVGGDLRVTRIMSASTNGRPIAIGTSTTTLHTSVTGTASIDQVWLWLSNTTTSSIVVTIEFGDTTSSDQLDYVVPPNDTIVALSGHSINNSLVVSALAVSTGVNAVGYVERVS
jgi:DNA repair exonuclease SbcCD ATPase subunit